VLAVGAHFGADRTKHITLRHAIVELLRSSGYKVLEAENSTQRAGGQHPGQLGILLTDIVMPGLRGPELARRVAKVHPEVQIVYISDMRKAFRRCASGELDVFAKTISFCNAPGKAYTRSAQSLKRSSRMVALCSVLESFLTSGQSCCVLRHSSPRRLARKD
jgi:FixJ family two-component response regulator